MEPIKDPYRSPQSLQTNRDGSYKPSIVDWLVLIFLVVIVGGIVFFGTCFGFGFAFVAVGDIHNSGYMNSILLLSIALGIAAAFFSVRALVLTFWKNGERNYLRNQGVGIDPVEGTKVGSTQVGDSVVASQTSTDTTDPNDGERK